MGGSRSQIYFALPAVFSSFHFYFLDAIDWEKQSQPTKGSCWLLLTRKNKTNPLEHVFPLYLWVEMGGQFYFLIGGIPGDLVIEIIGLQWNPNSRLKLNGPQHDYHVRRHQNTTVFTGVLSSGQALAGLLPTPWCQDLLLFCFIWPVFFQDVHLSDLSFFFWFSSHFKASCSLSVFVVVVFQISSHHFSGREKTLFCFFKVDQILHGNVDTVMHCLHGRRKLCLATFPYLPVESAFLVILSGWYWCLL